MNSMLVTVLVCTYNRADALRVVLDDLMQQDVPEHLVNGWDILVVDNNSSDGTKQLVERYARDFPHVGYLFEPRQGKSHALNSGVRTARGAIVALTDDDVRVPGNWVSAVEAAARRYPEHRA